MAATTSRSLIPSLYSDSKIHNPKPLTAAQLSQGRLKIPLHACYSNTNSKNNKKIQAIDLQKLIQDSPYEFDSKDSPASLPRPLTSAQLSNLTSEGSSLRVAYQGVRGAYSESAAEKAYPNCEPVPCEQFDTAFEAVEKWLVDRAVLPIENSLGGSIHRNYDLLLRHRLHIVGEVKLAIRHCLLANHGVLVEDLKRVLSHPQALAQCESTLTGLGLVREAVDDTAGAAKHVAFHKLKDAGAVASKAAARIYGLNILAEDIQDDSDNVTRFLMLAREPIIPGTDKPFKTSIVFSLEEGPGMLFKALAVFAMRNINLTKIESRPLQKQTLPTLDDSTNGFPKYFPYLFYVDFEASMADERAQNALGHLKEFATFLRVLGSYPTDTGLP
ncbi:arogenate dehydratase/prephenate dehydratase 2, chloroplastic-like isoform X2 [Olea europaea var. sylvestris]|uniref:Arogenate dehydratase n=1 Tax=Olea europaea subsp. europaea TaxID=158383 RepID=A0A8S0TVT2_OLEEU|nr:arogenate dehydratase/prephenate dehydratase 2, chloroplastic-like isoform X2 [Olea europaea var. sylvestris]CAA3009618.1 arogenate dehydratase prephenate dehydratase 2, chloroplastic [Olea europaea subsp. europaea]